MPEWFVTLSWVSLGLGLLRALVIGIDLPAGQRQHMIQNLWWATGYNVVAIPLAADVLYGFGILLSPAVGAVLMAASTVVVAINARFLRVSREGVS